MSHELCKAVTENSFIALSVFYFTDQLFEYWLGKTEKGSKIGLVITGFAYIAVLLLRRKDNGKRNTCDHGSGNDASSEGK